MTLRAPRPQNRRAEANWHNVPDLTPDDKHLGDARPTPSLRERARRAVQSELVEAAQRLFIEQGYEATTVDQIAAAAGMSRRSFFRYFGSKDELVLGKYDRLGEDFADCLAARPVDEPLWVSLRSVVALILSYFSDEEKARGLAAMDQVVNSSDALRAGYLERFDRAQETLAEMARDRAAAAGAPWSDGDPAPRAIVGAAFACLAAAHAASNRWGVPFDEAVDRAMAVVVVAP